MPRGIREPRNEQNARERKERVRFGAARQKMSVPELEGYFLCWINDVGNRLNEAQAGGYEFVAQGEVGKVGENLSQSKWTKGASETDSRISMVVGKQEDGSSLRAYLMKLKQEWRDEDMADRQAVHDEIDASLRVGNVNGEVGKDGRYIPDQGIKIG